MSDILINCNAMFSNFSDTDVNLRCLAAKVSETNRVYLSLCQFLDQMAAFSEFTIYSVTSLAAMVAMCQMRRLEYVRSEVSIPSL